MKLRPTAVQSVLLALACLLTATGCTLLPEAQLDPTRFYVLSTSAAGVTPQPRAPAVNLRMVELADYLRGRPVIVRKGDNEIEFREFARWGEPLDAGIARVLREELLARGAASAVRAPAARRDHAPDDYTLAVRVLAAEGRVNGGVEFRAIWELSTADAKAGTTVRGDFRPADLRWDGKDEASIAAQLSQAVAALAGEIAAALPKT
jgi:uncharacterized lipoprotein YmbA